MASELRRYREKNFWLLYRLCVSHVYFQRISFLSFVVVALFFVEADNMQDDVSTYFALVYRRREPALVMKRVKRQAMFRPSWKFEGKPNSIPPQFLVLCFPRGSSFSRSSFSRGSSFSRSSFSRGSLFSRTSFSRGSSFSRSSFSRGSSFSRSSFSRGSSFSRSSFTRGSSFSRSSFSRGSSFSTSLVFSLWSSFSRHVRLYKVSPFRFDTRWFQVTSSGDAVN